MEQKKVCVSSTLTPRWYISQMVTSKKTLGGTDATTQASDLKDRQTQTHGRHKAWQSLDLDRQTCIQSIEASKQANMDMHKGNDPSPLI